MRIWIFSLCVLLTACAGPAEKEEECMRIDLSAVLGQKPQDVSLGEWAKSIRYIPLETNDSILIKYISKLFKRGDKFLLSHSGRLSVFDSQGKYLHDIGKQGEGPDEYPALNDVVIGDDLIYVQIGWGSTIYKAFDWNGKCQGSIRFPENVTEIYPLPGKKEILGYIPNLNGDAPNRFYLLQDSIVIDSIPNYRKYPHNSLIITFMNEMRALQGSKMAAFKDLYCDTIYTVKNDLQLSPYAILNLGQYAPSEVARYSIATKEDLAKNPLEGKILIIVSGEVGDGLYLYSPFLKDQTLCYDKKKKESFLLKLPYPENEYQFPAEACFVPQFISDDNKYLIDYEQPENDNNPVLILVEP